MKNTFKIKNMFTIMLLSVMMSALSSQVPFVYSVENSGAECVAPPLPLPENLPSVVRLPNPFEFSDGEKTVNSFEDWKCRRNEIKAEIEHYEIGTKPARPADILASYADNNLTITIKENGETITLTSQITMPESGTGPFPVVIGIGRGTGSLPASLFTNCIKVAFVPGQIATDGRARTGAFYSMYPDLSSAHYAAWAWGVSRIIDGLEIVQSELNADLQRIGLTGCSRWGKLALFGDAFDERIALTIAQEPGGGGAAAWRVSETLGDVEKIDNTDYSWFMPSMRDNFKGRVERLPHDHHELISMIAPRAVLILGNDGWTWLADPSGYVSTMAAREVWKKFGIADRIGFDFTGGHNHCAAGTTQVDACERFIKRFLLNDNTVNTEILTSPYLNINYQFWISDWAEVTEPTVPTESNWFEPETSLCGTLGSDFTVGNDADASGGKFITAGSGLSSLSTPPGIDGQLKITFDIGNHGSGYVFIRVNSASSSPGALWAKIDNDDFTLNKDLNTDGEWQWLPLITNRALTKGDHTLTIAYASEDVKLDRILITNDPSTVPASGFGGVENDCAPPIKYTKLDFENGHIDAWTIQNPGAGISITQEDKYQGEFALKMVNGSGSDAWSVQAFTPDIEINSGHTYTVSFWIRAVDGGGRGRISTTGSGALGGTYWSNFEVGNDWQKITYNNLLANGSSVKLAFDMGYVPNKTYYIDDIVFNDTDLPEEGSGTKRISLHHTVFPNPVSDVLTISLLGAGATVDLYSFLGAKILSLKTADSDIQIDMKNKPDGVYLLQIGNGYNFTTKKIIKN